MFFRNKGYSQRKINKLLAKYTRLDEVPVSDAKEVVSKMESSDKIAVRDFEIDATRFDEYCARVEYQERYPRYFKQFGAENVWIRKHLEHFISFDLTQPKPGNVFIDVASSASPVYSVLKDHYGVTDAYRQDLNFPDGVREDTIGSNACAIPMEDASVDGLLAHNSWEHFEGDSDRGFLVEAQRLLKPGGMLVIIPFDIGNHAFQLTSPAVWHDKYVNAPKLPIFDPRGAVIVDESIKQRLIKIHSTETFLEDIEGLDDLAFTFWTVVNCGKYKFQRHFLTAEKR